MAPSTPTQRMRQKQGKGGKGGRRGGGRKKGKERREKKYWRQQEARTPVLLPILTYSWRISQFFLIWHCIELIMKEEGKEEEKGKKTR